MPSMTEWKDFGSLLAIDNSTAEPTVDATFRNITAFNTLGELNKMSASITTNEITIATNGTYLFVGHADFDGTNKTFELALYKNGVATNISLTDRASGIAGVSATVSLVVGDVISAYQRSTDGGTSLTVGSMSITLERLI